MSRTVRFLIVVPLSFTMLVLWFAWTAFRIAPQMAADNLRGGALSISSAIQQLASSDPAFDRLAGYSTPDIAYFSLVDKNGTIVFHTNPALAGRKQSDYVSFQAENRIEEQREVLGTGEEVYLLKSMINLSEEQYMLVLALHTYRADNLIRQVDRAIGIVIALTLALWGMTIMLFFMQKREEAREKEMLRREELARLGELSAVMAHEIRNPVAGIKGFAQLAQVSENIEQSREYAGIIVSQSIRMESLVNDLLAFARNDRREMGQTDIAGLAEDCVALVRNEADSLGISVRKSLIPNVFCRAVPEHLIQLILNLLKNSIQAMPEGGEIIVELEKIGKMAVLRIVDNGVGISEEDIPHIFEPFWTSKAEGTGLGLSLCQRIAEEHGGRLRLSSSSGAGSVATFELPLL